MIRFYFIASLLPALLLSSCVQYRDLVNFNETVLPEGVENAILDSDPLVVQAADLLRITVHSFDMLAAAPFNIEQPGEGQMMQQIEMIELFSGYLVDGDGYIDFPVIGRLEVSGKTIEQIKADLRKRLEAYLKEPVVNVRFLNFGITVLGSVAQPGGLRITNPRITLLQAVGRAGDFTDYADRERVLVIREREGQRSFAYLDLHSDEIFRSEYYFLEQNDVVYVPPLPARTAVVQERGQRVVQYGSALLSAAALLLAIFR